MGETDAGWLLDTSILIDLLRGNARARRWIDSLPAPSRMVSVITAVELLAGCRNQSEQRAIERELSFYELVWIDEDISRSALDLYRQHHLSHGVGFLDCVIAATAAVRSLRLATLNLKHFSPLPGVQTEAPFK
ncbi:MAG: type II toxin-antitoxin system VapC family toxin [Chloroflexi bacterium]|nr:type II toxin-antitoxin system VapC family toxin [Chloroflexota bacterium]